VVDYSRITDRPTSFIDSIYDVARFIKAFPDELPFFPKHSDYYSSDITVILPTFTAKAGASQVRRITSSGEFPKGKGRSLRASHAPQAQGEMYNQREATNASELDHETWMELMEKKKTLEVRVTD